MSNQAFLSETKRNAIIKGLVEATHELTNESHLRAATGGKVGMFDIVGSIHYCHRTDSLPSKLFPLVERFPAYGALLTMLDSCAPLQSVKPVEVQQTIQFLQPAPPVTAREEPVKETPVPSKKKRTYTSMNIYKFVNYVRSNPPRSVSRLAEHFGVSSSSVYRTLYTLIFYKKALDVPTRVIWSGATTSDVPGHYRQEVLEMKYVPPNNFEELCKQAAEADSPKKPVEVPVIERPTDKVDIAAMVLKAASAGDGEAAVKLAQMASLMKKYG